MTIAEKEDQLFNELRASDTNVVADGMVDEEGYTSASRKILFVLKEVNGGQGWDLREYLRNGGRAQTWDNIARWTEGILHIEENHPWSYFQEGMDARRKNYLRQICAINLSKTPGTSTSNGGTILKAAHKYSDMLKKQLSWYKPQIVVCCGTAYAFLSACFDQQNPAWQATSRGIEYLPLNDMLIISYAHPEARVMDCLLHYALIDAIQEIESSNSLHS